LNLNVVRLVTGPFQENAYIIWQENSNESLFIDPGSELEKLVDAVEEHGFEPQAIINTHAHLDHIGAVRDLQSTYSIPFYLHSNEKVVLNEYSRYSSFFGLGPKPAPEVDHWFDNQYWYFLYQDGIHVDRDSPENLWVLCKYCHTRKSHWESIGDYWTIERLVEKVKTPELRDALCNSSAKWISEHQDKKLKCCEYDKWVIPDDPNEPFYKQD